MAGFHLASPAVASRIESYNRALDAHSAARGPEATAAPELFSFVAAGQTIFALRTQTVAPQHLLISLDSTLFDANGAALTSVIDYLDVENSPTHERFVWSL